MENKITSVFGFPLCPKCGDDMIRRGVFTNYVELDVNDEGHPIFLEDEVEEYSRVNIVDKVFWKCDNCETKINCEWKDGKYM